MIPVTRVEGITRALVAPGGTGNVILGQAAVFDLRRRAGARPASPRRRPRCSRSSAKPAPALAGGSRASAILRLRETLQDAIDFNRNRAAWNAGQRRDYARGRLDLEALAPGDPSASSRSRSRRIAPATCSRRFVSPRSSSSSSSCSAPRKDGWSPDELARKNIPVVVKPLTNIPSFDALRRSLENAARLQQAGVTLVLSSFDTHNARNLRQEAGNAVSYGWIATPHCAPSPSHRH